MTTQTMTTQKPTNPPLRVVLDANVLYPFTLRDTFLRIATEEYIKVYWSQEILDEVSRNLILKAVITQKQLDHLLNAMNRYFPRAMVKDYEQLVDTMPNDEKDRHVAAVAVRASADVIITNNLKDFKTLPDGVDAQSPDDFLVKLFHKYPTEIIKILQEQAAEMKRPPITFNELLARLTKVAPLFVQAVYALNTPCIDC